MRRSDDIGYRLTSRVLHWTVALSTIALIALGWYMVRLDYIHPWSQKALAIHKALGMVVLMLAALMIVWQSAGRNRPIPLPRSRREVVASKATHYLLYSLAVIVPVSGYVISTSAGAGVSIFGFFDIPAFLPRSTTLRDLAIDVHYYLAYLGVGLIALHAAGALKHHFIDNDDTLLRMLRG